MSERIRGSYDDALYKSTYTLLYFTLLLYVMVAVRNHAQLLRNRGVYLVQSGLDLH